MLTDAEHKQLSEDLARVTGWRQIKDFPAYAAECDDDAQDAWGSSETLAAMARGEYVDDAWVETPAAYDSPEQVKACIASFGTFGLSAPFYGSSTWTFSGVSRKGESIQAAGDSQFEALARATIAAAKETS